MSSDKSYKNFSYVALGRILSNGLHAAFFIIFAALLEPALYGEIAFLISIAGTASIISRFGFPYSTIIYKAKNDVDSSDKINVLAAISTVIAALILLPINEFAAILCLGLSLFVMTQHNLLGEKKYKKYFVISVIQGSIFLTAPIFLYFVFGINGILLGMAISYLVMSYRFLLSLKLKKNLLKFFSSNKKVLIQNFGVDISINLPRWIDKLIIVPLLGFATVGIYQFNLQILFAFAVLPTALHSFLLSEESSGSSHKKISYFVIMIAIIISAIVIFISPFLINNWFPKYSDGIYGLQIIILSLVPLTVSSILNAKLQAKMSEKVGYSALVGIGSLIGFIILFGTMLGLEGLSWAVLSSATINAVVLIIFYFRSK